MFLGVCNVFRRFVPNIARKAAPLNNKLNKDQLNHFGDHTAVEWRALHEFHKKLVSAPIIAPPNAGGKYMLDTDACNAQVGCVLLSVFPKLRAAFQMMQVTT